MSFLNANLYGLATLSASDLINQLRLIRGRNLFRYREDQENSETTKFEITLREFFTSSAYACGVTNGTAGIRVALKSLGVNAGDWVGVSAYTFIATANAVLSLGAWPIPIDIDNFLGMDLNDLGRKATRLVGVIPVYIPGHASNVPDVKILMESEGKFVLEDACQGLGVRTFGQDAGLIGDIGVYSFQQNKQIASGEGGAIVSRKMELILRSHQYADHGAVRKKDGLPSWDSQNAQIGENLRMMEMQAALLLPQLRRLPNMIENQRRARNAIVEVVSNWPIEIVGSHDFNGDTGAYLILKTNSYHESVSLIEQAAKQKILIKFIWQKPFYEFNAVQKALVDQPMIKGMVCPNASQASKRYLAIPIPPTLKNQRLSRVLRALNNISFT